MLQDPVFTCRANGKLLLAGEYFVLDGGLSFAIPTRFGQSMEVSESNMTGVLHWQSIDSKDKLWYDAMFRQEDLQAIKSTDPALTRTLVELLHFCKHKNPDFLDGEKGLVVKTRLDFPREWGLGTSSTLVHCLANWAKIDQYILLTNSFGGSGYDLACANAIQPILYSRTEAGPRIIPCPWSPRFKKNLYFVYLGEKQNSREGILHYRKAATANPQILETVSGICAKISQSSSLADFQNLINKHEDLLSDLLKLEKVKDKYFHDFKGSVKSLGAWGGDFVLAASNKPESEIRSYFKTKDFPVILNWDDMIYKEN